MDKIAAGRWVGFSGKAFCCCEAFRLVGYHLDV